ncbi:hypothetical protein GGS21DRAFT_26317 [Xylaria nigripes]|nr:hypothetical protein GGS21DRAFT_26317 [Xylaria nigripes]
MQLHHLLQAVFITGVVSSRKDARQVVVTVTVDASPTPSGNPTAVSPLPLTEAPVPWEQTSPGGGPPPITTFGASSTSTSTDAAVPAPSASAGGPKCGKGYTYCGYTLTGDGHNFPSEDVDKAYCNGLPELCTGSKHKTDVNQAVFVCMSNQPSTVELLCACSGTCLNNASSNYIAHCDKPCVNAS